MSDTIRTDPTNCVPAPPAERKGGPGSPHDSPGPPVFYDHELRELRDERDRLALRHRELIRSRRELDGEDWHQNIVRTGLCRQRMRWIDADIERREGGE